MRAAGQNNVKQATQLIYHKIKNFTVWAYNKFSQLIIISKKYLE